MKERVRVKAQLMEMRQSGGGLIDSPPAYDIGMRNKGRKVEVIDMLVL
jgi:hypothetical protein